MRTIIRMFAVLLSFLTVAPAPAQQFPSTLPGNSVYGRLGGGTSGPGQAIPFANLVNGMAPFLVPVVRTGKLFLLFTAQSNFTQRPTLAWTPAANLFVWNNTVNVDGSVGNGFTAAQSTTVNAAERMASEIARLNPSTTVYMLNVSYDSMPISHWMVGTGAPDIYANILSNITNALAVAGLSKVDGLFWWQGDADRASYQTYLADFDTVMARFEAQTWFPVGTPKFLWGLASSASTSDTSWDTMNNVLQAVVAEKPFDRQLFSPSMFAASYWTGNLSGNHMNANGYFLAGSSAAYSWLTGTGQNVVQDVVSDTKLATVGIGTLPTVARLSLGKGSSITRIMRVPFVLSDSREAMLHLQGADGFANINTVDAWGTSAIPWMALRTARGTATTPTATQLNDYLGILSGDGYGTTLYSVGAGELAFQATENFTDTANGTKLAVRLTPAGSASSARADRFTVAGDGTLGIFGATSGVQLVRASGVATGGTLTLPNGTDTLVAKATTDTLTNKTIGTGGLIFTNATSGSITLTPPTGALGTVTLTMPAASTTLVGTDVAQTLSSKTITSPSISSPTITTGGAIFTNATSGSITLTPPVGALGTVTLTMPAATTNLVGNDTTQTLTGKTYDTAGAGNVLKINGTTVNAVAGTSNTVALNTEGTFVPVLQFGGATTGITYGTQSGDYVRTGNRVDVWINIVLTSKGSAVGSATIASLPFTAAQTAIGAFQLNTGAAGVTTMTTSNVVSTTSAVNLQKFAAGSSSALVDTDFNNTSVIRVSISYRI